MIEWRVEWLIYILACNQSLTTLIYQSASVTRTVLSPANPAITFAFLTFPIYSSSYVYLLRTVTTGHNPVH